MADIQIVIGDKAAELSAIQVLSVAVGHALSRLEHLGVQETPRWVVGPLLMAASHNLALAGLSGIETPLEVLALSARNTFEILLRLIHILKSEEDRQVWRDENLTDQIELYEAILTLETSNTATEGKAVLLAEVLRITQIAASRGINRRDKLMSAHALAKATGHKAEYDAFWKLYSKLVHPSSWRVNSPSAVSTPMYRIALTSKAQVYGWEILKVVEKEFGVSADACYASAVAILAEREATGATATRLVQ